MQTLQQEEKLDQLRAISRPTLLAGAAVAILCSLLFFSFYWNRFAGLRSGNGSFEGGIAFLQGLRPYRDYYTAAPPFNLFISASVLALFGKTLAVIRAYGVFERMLLAAVLYFWLARFFGASTAAFATILAIVISAGDPSDTLSSYNFATVLFGAASGFAASVFIDRGRGGWPAIFLAIVSGAFAAMAFATKQTIGLGVMLAVPCLVAACAFKLSGIKKASLFLIFYIVGWGLTVASILIWLGHLGILHEFFLDIFVKGPSAKASHPSEYLIRTARAIYHVRFAFLGGCLALLLSIPSLRRSIHLPQPGTQSKSLLLWILALISAGSISVGAFISYHSHSFLSSLPNYPIFFGFYGSGLLALMLAVGSWRRAVSEREAQLFLLSGVSFSIALMLSLSWPALDGMLYPALGLVLAAAIDGMGSRAWQYVIYGICAVLLVSETCGRLNLPQGFHEWVEPPAREATATSSIPELAGMRLPSTVVRFLDTTAGIVAQHSTPQDTIFCYPEFGIIYPLFHRHWPTETSSHNIDVVNDEFARAEAQRLLQKRPAVLIYYRIPEEDLHGDEVYWRSGRRSGQRDLINAMETLASQYHLVGTFQIPPNPMPVLVYVRQ
jgi:hypothetical protein